MVGRARPPYLRFHPKRESKEAEMSNKELSRRFTDLFSTGDLASAEEFMSPDVVVHGTSADGEVRGLEPMLEFVAAYRSAFPDARSSVEDQVAEGDKVVTRWRAQGTHRADFGEIPATGREIDITGITIERIADDRIAEVWVVRDWLGLLRQLGVVPEAETAAA
jgi:steroid delta-isomerase-like uncharacterized protein